MEQKKVAHRLTYDTRVAVSRDFEHIRLWSLVLSAVHVSHQVRVGEGGWEILVTEPRAEMAAQELRHYEEENQNWPPQQENISVSTPGSRQPFVVPMVGSLALFYSVTGPWADGAAWFKQGALIQEQVMYHNEWYRVFTALTLHADVVHLAGNVAFGGLLAYFLCRHLGNGLAWALILMAGCSGNLLSVTMQGHGYQAVGFSTAVFGMVGLLCGLRLRRLGAWYEVVLALGSGLSLLAMLGTAGERTDLGAHLWGLAAGFIYGGALLYMPERLSGILTRQKTMFFVSCSLMIGSWWLAVS